MRGLNCNYRKLDRATDVLSFHQQELNPAPPCLGWAVTRENSSLPGELSRGSRPLRCDAEQDDAWSQEFDEQAELGANQLGSAHDHTCFRLV